MSMLSNLLRQVEQQNRQLAADIASEVAALSARREFGLNFERHHSRNRRTSPTSDPQRRQGSVPSGARPAASHSAERHTTAGIDRVGPWH